MLPGPPRPSSTEITHIRQQESTQMGSRRHLAVITTEWRYHCHAWHMAERFLVGYPTEGKWHTPELEVVSA